MQTTTTRCNRILFRCQIAWILGWSCKDTRGTFWVSSKIWIQSSRFSWGWTPWDVFAMQRSKTNILWTGTRMGCELERSSGAETQIRGIFGVLSLMRHAFSVPYFWMCLGSAGCYWMLRQVNELWHTIPPFVVLEEQISLSTNFFCHMLSAWRTVIFSFAVEPVIVQIEVP